MRRLSLLDTAVEDLVDIFAYISRESASRAIGRRFVDLLQRQCSKLASLPGTLGQDRPEFGFGLRSFTYRGYVIIFRYRDEIFEVVNILEGHRDVAGYFRKQ